MKQVRLTLVQMSCQPDAEANLARAEREIASAATAGAHIVCLPELFRTPYFCRTLDHAWFDAAEAIDGPTVTALARAARQHGVAVLAPIFERRAAGIYHNTAVMIDADGSQVGLYRKMHIPDDPGFTEKYYFTPGDRGFVACNTKFARLGLLICWDQWFPEAARLTAMQGAEILLYPTAIGWLSGESETERKQMAAAWEAVQRAHAIANGVFVVAINRVGYEGDTEFWGGSFVFDPLGECLARAGLEEQTLIVDCPLERIEQVRRVWPFLRDRRIDEYHGLTQRWGVNAP